MINNIIKAADKLALRGIAALAGVRREDLEALSEQPQYQKLSAAQEIILGEPVKQTTVYTSSSRGIPHAIRIPGMRKLTSEEYKDLISKAWDDDPSHEFDEDHYNKVAAEETSRNPRISDLIQFTASLVKHYPGANSKTTWREISPSEHLQAVHQTIGEMLESESITMNKIAQCMFTLYYATYNALVGVRTAEIQRRIAA